MGEAFDVRLDEFINVSRFAVVAGRKVELKEIRAVPWLGNEDGR